MHPPSSDITTLLTDTIGRIHAVEPDPATLANAALLVADCLAVACSTVHEPEVRAARNFVLERSHLAEARLFGGPSVRGDRFLAAAANAMAMTTSEFDGGAQHTPCHAGLYIVPALLAEAEVQGARCREVLVTLVRAYELTVRIAGSFKSMQGAYPNLYTHARFAVIGAACGRAMAAGASEDELRETIGIAATLITAGPRNHLIGGAMARNIWPAAATQNGMMSLEWARWGELALPTSLTDAYCGVLGFRFDATMLSAPLGSDWEINHTYHRVYACHLFYSAMIEALLEIRDHLQCDDRLDEIESIEILIHPDAIDLTDPTPRSSLSARFSTPHVAATAILTGQVGPDAFSHAMRDDTRIDAVRRRVTVRPLPPERFPGAKWPAAAVVTAAGKAYTASREEAVGGHGRPHAVSTVLDKIDGLTRAEWPGLSILARRMVALEPAVLDMPVTEFFDRAANISTA